MYKNLSYCKDSVRYRPINDTLPKLGSMGYIFVADSIGLAAVCLTKFSLNKLETPLYHVVQNTFR